jgi:hypothetical protein
MNPSKELHIREAALRFRVAIQSADRKKLAIGLQNFPRGACSDSALLLGTYLTDQHLGEFSLVTGRKYPDGNLRTHGWLSGEGLIVDITADQFPEIKDPVIVVVDSPWHDEWAGKIEGRAHIAAWEFLIPLDDSYAEIRRHLE